MEEKVIMEGYKGFNPDFTCLDKQYVENTAFEESESNICKNGMHFCENPFDVLDHYPLVNNDGKINEFAKVEALDEAKTDDGKKFCTKKLKVGAKLGLKGFIKACLDFNYKKISEEAKEKANGFKAGGDYARLAGGNRARLAGGDYARLAGGDYARLAGGDEATLAGGNRARLAGGNWAALAGGYRATLAGGDYARLAGGDYARLAGGNWARLAGGNRARLAGGDEATLAGGDEATLAGGKWATLAGGYRARLAGGDGALLVGDNGSVAKAKKGSVIVLVKRDKNVNITEFKAEQVDGERIKEDTFYKLENGEFVEVKE